MYSRFIKWIFTSHRTTLGWKVPFQKYLWCSGDWVMVRRNARLAVRHRRWLRACHAMLFMPPLSISLISSSFSSHCGSPSHVRHKSLAKGDFPRHKRLGKHAKFEASCVQKKKALNALNYDDNYLASQRNKRLAVKSPITTATLTAVQILGNILSAGGWWHLLEEPRTGHWDVKSDSESEVTSRLIRWHMNTHTCTYTAQALIRGNFRA